MILEKKSDKEIKNAYKAMYLLKMESEIYEDTE